MMCKKPKGIHNRIDKCMINLINFLNNKGWETIACCCGHNKYQMTIIVREVNGNGFELLQGIDIPRKRNFYKKDKQGYYFIPEVKQKW